MERITEEPCPREAQQLLRIGRREHIDFPEWGVRRVRVKIDTGAYSSALDVAGYELLQTPGGPVAELRLMLNRRRPGAGRVVRAPVVGFTTVRSTTGCPQRRPVFSALVRLGPVNRRIRLTVTDRSRMRCRMLLGREALAGVFVVDVQGKDLLAQVSVPASPPAGQRRPA
ncbi:MAG: RimK/LysX family protein [Gemmataceae bacterium]